MNSDSRPKLHDKNTKIETDQCTTDFNFVDAFDKLMGSLPEDIAARISYFEERSGGIDNIAQGNTVNSVIISESKNDPDEVELLYKNPNIEIYEENWPTNNKSKDSDMAQPVTEKQPRSKQLNNTCFILTDIASTSHSKDFELRLVIDDLNANEKEYISEKSNGILISNLKVHTTSNENNKNGLIQNTIIGFSDKPLHTGSHNSKNFTSLHDTSDLNKTNTQGVNFDEFSTLHVGDGDCHIIAVKHPNQNNRQITVNLQDEKTSAFEVPLESPNAQQSKMGLNKTPIETHWALTRITKYKDLSTYKVMKPFKKAPKVIPKVTDKVFLVMPDENTSAFKVPLESSNAKQSKMGLNKTPIETHWALTRITKYKDSTTYEVMKPYKKAPKVIPKVTDKVFIVMPDEKISAFEVPLESPNAQQSKWARMKRRLDVFGRFWTSLGAD